MAWRKVIIEGKKLHERAYLGWQRKDMSLYGVRQGYLDSANDLVEIAMREGSKGDIATLDMYIFPIFFLYRHSIEISIKNIYHRFYGKIPKGGHNLLVLWDKISKEVIAYLDDPEFIENVKSYKDKFIKFSLDGINFDELRAMLKEINGIDEQSDVFRYLLDKNGELYFKDWEYIDYPNLKESMNYLYEVLDFIHTIVDEYLSS